jgi:hypothetical protein
MRKYGKPITLAWRIVDRTSGAKKNRVHGLEVLLADDRLFFVEGDWIDITFQQFTSFTGFSKRRKDDIPDAISFLQRLIPREAFVEAETVESETERKKREAQEMRDKFAREQNDAAYRTVFAAPIPPPAQVQQPVRPEDLGPERIFGGLLHL